MITSGHLFSVQDKGGSRGLEKGTGKSNDGSGRFIQRIGSFMLKRKLGVRRSLKARKQNECNTSVPDLPGEQTSTMDCDFELKLQITE